MNPAICWRRVFYIITDLRATCPILNYKQTHNSARLHTSNLLIFIGMFFQHGQQLYQHWDNLEQRRKQLNRIDIYVMVYLFLLLT